jgi:hypothetical protein
VANKNKNDVANTQPHHKESASEGERRRIHQRMKTKNSAK